MSIEVLLDTPEITVIGTPATVEVLVDYGATGPRGSQIYSGIANPNTTPPSSDVLVNDLYILKSSGLETGGFYQYLSDGGSGYQWTKIADFNPAAWTAGQTLIAKTNSFTLGPVEIGALVTITKATAVTVTIDTNTNFAEGQRTDLVQLGAGQVTVAASGVTLIYTPTAKLRSQNSGATIVCLDTNIYWLTGDLAAI